MDAGSATTAYPDGLVTVNVGFKTGPNPYPYPYDVKCYPIQVDSQGDLLDAPTCEELPSSGLTAYTESGTLPLKYSLVDATFLVQGLESPGLDCYVTVMGPTGKNSKCTYAGRAVPAEPTTITCLGVNAGETFWVNGREMTVVENAATRYTTGDGTPYTTSDFEYYTWGSDPTLYVDTNWFGLPNICTSNVQDMSAAFGGTTFGEVAGNINSNWTITQWDLQSTESTAVMFGGTGTFDQPIGAWNTTHVGLSATPLCDVLVDRNCAPNAMNNMFAVRKYYQRSP